MLFFFKVDRPRRRVVGIEVERVKKEDGTEQEDCGATTLDTSTPEHLGKRAIHPVRLSHPSISHQLASPGTGVRRYSDVSSQTMIIITITINTAKRELLETYIIRYQSPVPEEANIDRIPQCALSRVVARQDG
jgi:hypothetical protein